MLKFTLIAIATLVAIAVSSSDNITRSAAMLPQATAARPAEIATNSVDLLAAPSFALSRTLAKSDHASTTSATVVRRICFSLAI
jgi:hypothetical protein